MKDVLVDTSIWIDYFRGKPVADALSDLIDDNCIVTNDLILAELIPFIAVRGDTKLGDLLLSIRRVELAIDWSGIIEMQTANLKSGHNNAGIPDLLIAQSAIDNDLILFENDKHFRLMQPLFGLVLLRTELPASPPDK